MTDSSLEHCTHQGILKIPERRRNLAGPHPQNTGASELAKSVQYDPAWLERQARRDILNFRDEIRLLHAEKRQGYMELPRLCGAPGYSQGLLSLVQSEPDPTVGHQGEK